MHERYFIQRISTAVPALSITLEESIELAGRHFANPREHKLYQRLARLAGVQKRHLAILEHMSGATPFYQQSTLSPQGPGMSQRTALFDACAKPLVTQLIAALPKEQLDRVGTLITATCTQAASPGIEQPILDCGLSGQVQRWNLGFMGCSAGLAGMRLVHQLQPRQPESSALIVCCELSSLHFQFTSALDQMTANVLFSDGAAAVLLSTSPTAVEVIHASSLTLTAGADQMVWFAGDHGLQLRLSPHLPVTLAAQLPQAIDEFLNATGIPRREINHWLVHPGGPQILDSVEQCLGLSKESLTASRAVLRDFGNMSSPTIFFIMKSLIESAVGGTCMAIAFGPGLTIEMVLLRITR